MSTHFFYRFFYSTFALLLLCILLVSFSNAQANSLQQRWLFKEAHQAILNDDLDTFKRLSAQLQDYPIVHYLRYFQLKSQLDAGGIADTNLKSAKILYPRYLEEFLAIHKKTPFAKSLRRDWLKQLAEQEDWETFLAVYTPQKNTVLRCQYVVARLNSQGLMSGKLLLKAKKLWLVGRSQPTACDPVFDYLYDNNIITPKMRWKRIRLTIQKGNFGLARYLAKGLPKIDRHWVTAWQSMHQKPDVVLQKINHPDIPISREILLYGLRRLARSDAGGAYHHLENYQTHYSFTNREKAELFHYIALRSASQNHPEASRWLKKVDKDLVNGKVRNAILQYSLRQQNWQAVIDLIQSLSVAERDKLQFKYWRARALEAIGYTNQAEKLFLEVSKNRNYYGFLASDRLGQAYNFQDRPLNIGKILQNQLLNKHLGLIRARELYFIGQTEFARFEWQAVLPSLNSEELKTAAVIADGWGWHDRAIVTIGKANYFDALKIRFPLPFYDEVLSMAQAQLLDYAYVYGVMRQESIFQADAGSVVGALGLMQLMPATARDIARRQNIILRNRQDILVPATNIQLGTTYLRWMLNRFKGNYLLATAAYNAGPTRAKRWAKQYGCLPPDIWVELIPFTETRKYVQGVLSFTSVFEYRLVGHKQVKPMRLDALPGCDG